MANKKYKIEYDKFIDTYKKGIVDGEEVGAQIVRLAQYYAETNVQLTLAENSLSIIYREIAGEVDENTDKPIAVGKATIKVDATPEAAIVRECKADLKNIEQFINSLKSLQKGILNEYSHMS